MGTSYIVALFIPAFVQLINSRRLEASGLVFESGVSCESIQPIIEPILSWKIAA